MGQQNSSPAQTTAQMNSSWSGAPLNALTHGQGEMVIPVFTASTIEKAFLKAFMDMVQLSIDDIASRDVHKLDSIIISWLHVILQQRGIPLGQNECSGIILNFYKDKEWR